ncbi:hypothetical protein CVS28_13725 [Arthrobacter glacialis]|nr:hypothetical protein CVS28_13725 [Arthrobacter glacialis]
MSHSYGTLCVIGLLHFWGLEFMVIFLYQFGPTVVALLLACGVSFIRRRSHVVLPKTVRQFTSVGIVLALGFMITFTAWSVFPWWMPHFSEDTVLFLQLGRYLAPLVLTVVALVLLIVPVPAPGPRGTAALAPRTLMTFTSRAWLGSAVGVMAVVSSIAFFAGLASSPDERGRHVMFVVRSSANSSASTTIYGWWFSTPCLIMIALIATIVVVALIMISRPALAVDSQRDTAARVARIGNVLSVSTGGLLLHLSVVLQSLSNTSSLRTGQAGWFELGTSFAALGPALQLASLLSFICGMAMWWSTLLTVLPARTRQTSRAALA